MPDILLDKNIFIGTEKGIPKKTGTAYGGLIVIEVEPLIRYYGRSSVMFAMIGGSQFDGRIRTATVLQGK